VRGRLADELELARDRHLTDVLRRVGFEPVDELLEELVDLVLVVAAADDGEVRRPQSCDVVPIHGPWSLTNPRRCATWIAWEWVSFSPL